LYKYDSDMKEDVWVQSAELPDPKIEKASDVIVRIGAAGVCRTDLHIIEGAWRHIQDPDDQLLPCVMGHENAGWIEEVGKDVSNFKKGDPVILHPVIQIQKQLQEYHNPYAQICLEAEMLKQQQTLKQQNDVITLRS